MTLVAFDTPTYFPFPVFILLSGVLILLLALCAGLLYGSLSYGGGYGRTRIRLGALASTFFTFLVFRPFYPYQWEWPRVIPPGAVLAHCAVAGLFGAAAFGLSAYRPVSSWKRVVLGSVLGAAAGLAGVYANRGLFAADILGRVGYGGYATLLFWGLPAAFFFLIGIWVLLAFLLEEPSVCVRVGIAALLLLGWAGTSEYGERWLKSRWDCSQPDLRTAAGIRGPEFAPMFGVAVLAASDGSPGEQYREIRSVVDGLDASRESLDAVEAYLLRTGFRTIHLKRALSFLRQGEKMHWEAERYLDATALRFEPGFPPATLEFLEAIRYAPAVTANYGRLEALSQYAWKTPIFTVDEAQKTFEGFSTAYARYGELKEANRWLYRIDDLWPLSEVRAHVEPIEENHDGHIAGTLLYEGEAARRIRVGLFAIPSTTTILNASAHLVSSTFPDENGRFLFERLLPGRYYLALRGDPIFLGGRALAYRNSPGEVRLHPLEMGVELLPIEITRRPHQAGG